MGKNKKSKQKKAEDFKKVKLKVGKLLKKTRDTQAQVTSKTLTLTTQLEKTPGQRDRHDFLTPLRHPNTKIKISAVRSLLNELNKGSDTGREWLESSIFCFVLPLLSDLESDVRTEIIILIAALMKKVTDTDLSPYYALIVGHITFGLTHVHSQVKNTALKMILLLLDSHPNLPPDSSSNLWRAVIDQTVITSQTRAQKVILASTILTLLNGGAKSTKRKGIMVDNKNIYHINVNSDNPHNFGISLIPNYTSLCGPFDFPLAQSSQSQSQTQDIFDSNSKETEYFGPLKSPEILLDCAPKLWTFLIAFWTELTCKEQAEQEDLTFTNSELEIMENILKILDIILMRTSNLIKDTEGSADSKKLQLMCKGFMSKKNVTKLSAVLPCSWMPDKDQKGRPRSVRGVNKLLASVLQNCIQYMPLQAVNKWLDRNLIKEQLKVKVIGKPAEKRKQDDEEEIIEVQKKQPKVVIVEVV